MARPAFRPTAQDYRTVKAMVGYGIPQDKIAKVLGIAETTLRTRFAKELEIGAAEMNAQVAQSMLVMALGREAQPARDGKAAQPAVPAQQNAAAFWLARRGGDGWRDLSRADDENKGVTVIVKIEGPDRPK